MINVATLIIGILLFIQSVCIVSLLRPIKEPYDIRTLWFSIQEKFCIKEIAVLVISFLTGVSILDIFLEELYYEKLLNDVQDPELTYQFYLSKVTMCVLCGLITVYQFVLIERLAAYLTVIARLLEFELMCRHTILCQNDPLCFRATALSTASIFSRLRMPSRDSRSDSLKLTSPNVPKVEHDR